MQLKFFIANFGYGNWAWEQCLKQNVLAVMDDVRVHPKWEAGDRAAYISTCQRELRRRGGKPITDSVASRWFNLNTLMRQTSGDLWIHRQKDELWWTRSMNESGMESRMPDPDPHEPGAEIVIHYKPCEPWSNKDARGVTLLWHALHPKAKEFLFTEGTAQQLSADHAEYADSLLNGRNLDKWHNRPEWESKAKKYGATKGADVWQRSAVRMVETAFQTVHGSGRTAEVFKKIKECGFDDRRSMEMYVADLLKAQGSMCALSGLAMLSDDEEGDREFLCSLDRIDSDAHYSKGNLQIVCRFINRWKSNTQNEKFLELLNAVKERASEAAIIGE